MKYRNAALNQLITLVSCLFKISFPQYIELICLMKKKYFKIEIYSYEFSRIWKANKPIESNYKRITEKKTLFTVI